MTSIAKIPAPPQQMIADIAYGMEEPVDVAFRYGYSVSEFKQLEEHTPFVAAVAAVRADLERNGHGVKVKAQWMTENLLDDLFVRAKSAHASITQVQETVKIMAKLADLEPKNNAAQVPAGNGTSVQIIFNTTGAEVVIGSSSTEEAQNQPAKVWDLPAEEVDARDVLPGMKEQNGSN